MISIFAKETFLNINPGEPFRLRTKPPKGHLMRVSSLIRGDQIAERIGAKYNPESGYEQDTCIYVKPMVRKGDDFEFKGKKSYIDIVDGHNLGQLAQKHPEVGVIVCSKADQDIMSKELKNEIVLIPQHHCNFERVSRIRNEVTRVGIIGELPAFNFLPPNLEKELSQRGMELVKFSKFFTRQDIIDFYLNIDVQIVWRPYKKILSNPLKIVNAASFGVPTIALDERAFYELDGCYIPVADFEGFLKNLDNLRTNEYIYFDYSQAALEKAEEYHIDKIADMYRRLDQ